MQQKIVSRIYKETSKITVKIQTVQLENGKRYKQTFHQKDIKIHVKRYTVSSAIRERHS